MNHENPGTGAQDLGKLSKDLLVQARSEGTTITQEQEPKIWIDFIRNPLVLENHE